jgi:hypothetical protein
VRANLPTAEFAFLSACHTAEVTEGSVIDEGLHLAAAVQYCGFCSVVGMMWAMVDEDGRDLAKNFLQGFVREFERDAVPRKICEGTLVCGENFAEEEADHPGEMVELRPLWCMTGGHQSVNIRVCFDTHLRV